MAEIQVYCARHLASLAVSVVVIGLILLDAFEDAPRHEPNAGGE